MSARKTFNLPGLRPAQRVILAILAAGPATTAQIAAVTDRAERDVRASLQKLVSRGMVEAGHRAQRRPEFVGGPIPQNHQLTRTGHQEVASHQEAAQ